MIPEKFVNLYGKFLSSSICLKLPNGFKWQIGLTSAADGTVWLENGWHRFSERYGLKFGSILVCRFDGKSTFHTILWDATGLEIEYADDLKKENASFPDRCQPKIEHEEGKKKNWIFEIKISLHETCLMFIDLQKKTLFLTRGFRGEEVGHLLIKKISATWNLKKQVFKLWWENHSSNEDLIWYVVFFNLNKLPIKALSCWTENIEVFLFFFFYLVDYSQRVC